MPKSSLPPPAAETLLQGEMFAGVVIAGLEDALRSGRIRHISRNTIIFRQGEPAERAHALVSGQVKITQGDSDGGQLLIRFIGAGQTFGTFGLFTDQIYPADAIAVSECVEISWSESDLRQLLVRHPQIAVNLVKIAAERLQEAQNRLRELATQRVERRIAHVLLRLAAQAGQAVEEGVAIDFPLGRKDLAEMCGATLHTISRTLTAWEKAGLLCTNLQRVTIRDMGALESRAQQ